MNSTLDDRIRDTVPEQVTTPDVDRLRRAGRRRRHLKRAAAAGGSTLAAIGIVAALTSLPAGTPTVEPLTPPVSEPAAPPAPAASRWSPELVEAAEATPRLLVTQPGWEITSAMFTPASDEFTGGERQLDFGDGDQEAELQWTAGDVTDELIADLTDEGLVAEQTAVLGHAASLLSLPGPSGVTPSPGTTPDDAQAQEQAYALVFFDGEFTIELVAVANTRDEFVELVDSLEQVDASTWLSALPDGQIPPTDPDAFVTEVLTDVPTPPDFDTAQISAEPLEHPYFLTARVVAQVSCGWIADWVQAQTDSDTATARAAVDAMATIAESDAVEFLNTQGGFGGVVTQYADAIAGDGTVTMGRVLTVEESYEDALGC